MSVLGAFDSTWSKARSTFGAGEPQTGAPFDASNTLQQLQSDVASAAPGSAWSGDAANSYDTANTGQQRVIGAMADLDQRLRGQVDSAANVVSTGRSNLDAIQQWVRDSAAAAPEGEAGERIKLAIARNGISQVAEILTRSDGDLSAIGENLRELGGDYDALNEGKGDVAKFAGDGEGEGDQEGEEGWQPDNEYEQALHDEGLLDEEPTGYYAEWLQNAQQHGVSPDTVVEIAQQQNLTQQDFDLLERTQKVEDPDGKLFFMLPTDISGEDAKKAVLLTYILNCDTGYGEGNDFPPTPYSAAEVQRIADRQNSNSWTYNQDVDFVHDNGGRLVTTPNGMMMGLGGNWLTDRFSVSGGTAWGDIYMENIDNIDDPAGQLRDIVESGKNWGQGDDGKPYATNLDLDRLLHHEERHSQQWAERGYLGFLDAYASGAIIDIFADHHPLEEDAGLEDGGY